MREVLQKETVDWQLQGMGYVPGVYVYGMTDPSQADGFRVFGRVVGFMRPLGDYWN